MRAASARRHLCTLPLDRAPAGCGMYQAKAAAVWPQPSRRSCIGGPLTLKEMCHDMALPAASQGAEWFATASASVFHGEVVGSRATAYWGCPSLSGHPP